ncbi:hypothetical protein FUMI01_31360 [Flavobacterium sp. UMI-01]|nr:hypothetical protein FUMI01_31360 [Flavobacterium sp. UMI-01]
MVCDSQVYAHVGGHSHHNSRDVLSVWTLKSGALIYGDFSSGTNDYLILEQVNGKRIKLPIRALNLEGQTKVRSEINKISQLNNFESTETAGNSFRIQPFLCMLFSLLSVFILLFYFCNNYFNSSCGMSYYKFLRVVVLLFLSIGLFSFSINTNLDIEKIAKTSTKFLETVFKPYSATVATSWDAKYFYVSSSGIPQHNMMEGITSWQQQVPIPQNYTGANSWAIPLQPVYADVPLSTKNNFMKGAIAIAVNGVPIFNALNNRGEDAYLVGELDKWGGHCGRADDYHYHVAPLHLKTTSGLMPIAFALDGFPVYGDKEPDGSAMESLDECHGHFYKNEVYHYHGTFKYPYVVGAFKGVVNSDPRTTAPENQILPQAFATPLRPAEKGLRGAKITSFESPILNAYKLTYQVGSDFGYVEYKKITDSEYQFIFTDHMGNKKTTIYQQKNKKK